MNILGISCFFHDAAAALVQDGIVTAAAEQIPEALLQQLAVGGMMILPLGPHGGHQCLVRLTRSGVTASW